MMIQEERIQVNGLSVRYLQSGQGELPLVLLHGTGESALGWRWVMPKLGERYRVYAPDFPGTGGSTKLLSGYSAELLTQFVVDFIKVLSLERAVIVGNSLGGLIALKVALTHASLTAGLVLRVWVRA